MLVCAHPLLQTVTENAAMTVMGANKRYVQKAQPAAQIHHSFQVRQRRPFIGSRRSLCSPLVARSSSLLVSMLLADSGELRAVA